MPLTTIFGTRAGAFSTTAELTIRGGGKPYSNLALMPTDRMGPPPGASPPMRMIASWSGSNDPTAHKSVARRSVPNGELPSDPQHTGRQAPIRHRSYAKSPSRSSSSLRVLRRQGAAKHKRRSAASRQAMLPFRSLDPFRPLREPDRRRRDEERLSRSEQRTANKPKDHLTGNAPYRFESTSIQRRVR